MRIGSLGRGRQLRIEFPLRKEKKVVFTDIKEASIASVDVVGRESFSLEDIENRIQSEAKFSGEFLAAVRQSREITLEEISDKTKIGRDYLRAIEQNDFARFPARIYLRGFLWQYAAYIGLDPKKVCDSYLAQIPKVQEKQLWS